MSRVRNYNSENFRTSIRSAYLPSMNIDPDRFVCSKRITSKTIFTRPGKFERSSYDFPFGCCLTRGRTTSSSFSLLIFFTSTSPLYPSPFHCFHYERVTKPLNYFIPSTRMKFDFAVKYGFINFLMIYRNFTNSFREYLVHSL